MAGDWIKMRSNLWDDPRVQRLCDETGQIEAAVVGALYWLWATADQHSEDGSMPGMELRAIDRKTGIRGIGVALVLIGWLAETDTGLRLARFDEHNGTSAKRRCEDAKRKAGGRKASASVRTKDGHDADVSRQIAEQEKEKEKEKEGKSTPLAASLAAGDPPSDPDAALKIAASGKPDCPHQDIVALYHELLPMCPEIRDWTASRAKVLRARWNENPKHQDLDYWRRLFGYIANHNDFLIGKAGKTPFLANLPWIIDANNFAKIRERHYENNA